MPTVIEKVIIPILILVGIAIGIYNPMSFELSTRLLLGCVITALLVLLAYWLSPQHRTQSKFEVSTAIATRSTLLNRTGYEQTVPSATLLSPEIDIGPILADAGRQTTAQLNNRLAPYRGRKVTFSGEVINVRSVDAGYQVQFRPNDSSLSAFLTFKDEWNHHLHSVSKGAEFKVAGVIRTVEYWGLSFDDCSIIP